MRLSPCDSKTCRASPSQCRQLVCQVQLPSLGLGGISEELSLTQEAVEDLAEASCHSAQQPDDYQWAMAIIQQLSTMIAGDSVSRACFRDGLREFSEKIMAVRRQQCPQPKRPHADAETISVPNSEALSRRKKSKRIPQGYET
jgi:hypothetical protein